MLDEKFIYIWIGELNKDSEIMIDVKKLRETKRESHLLKLVDIENLRSGPSKLIS